MHGPLTVNDLYPLEHYSRIRSSFRKKAITHMQQRRVQLGEHMVLCFEDNLTVQFQVQEILHAGRIFECDRIKAELDAYTPLLPCGDSLKASMMLPTDKKTHLAETGESIWLQCGESSRVYARSDYKMTRVAAMQWLVFELDEISLSIFKSKRGKNHGDSEDISRRSGAQSVINLDTFKIGVDHERYCHQLTLPQSFCESIASDLW